jgi:hypothetical protein
MEYDIIRNESSVYGLIFEVNKRIKDGWEPQGGICIEYSNEFRIKCYYQAMIKR